VRGAQARGLGLGAAGIGADPDPVHGTAVDRRALAEARQLRGAQVADDAVGVGGQEV
jgi:glutamate mutase epsilon subunit